MAKKSRLTVQHFNTPEYWGKGGNIPGGYGDYQPMRPHGDWRERAEILINDYGLSGLVLELGCAMGSWVKALRELGVDAYGLDLPWPIKYGVENLWPELEPYLLKGDVREYLQGEWDFVISWNFLECQSDEELDLLIRQLDIIAKRQIHIVDPRADGEFYNKKTLDEWRRLLGPESVVLDGC